MVLKLKSGHPAIGQIGQQHKFITYFGLKEEGQSSDIVWLKEQETEASAPPSEARTRLADVTLERGGEPRHVADLTENGAVLELS